jgi:hypothetical protein
MTPQPDVQPAAAANGPQRGRRITTREAVVRTATISVKVLTIEKRQVTLAVFRQLKQGEILDFNTGQLRGVPWGVVGYHPGAPCLTSDEPHLHVVWQQGDELRRSTTPLTATASEVWRAAEAEASRLARLSSLRACLTRCPDRIDAPPYDAHSIHWADDRVAVDTTVSAAVEAYWAAEVFAPALQRDLAAVGIPVERDTGYSLSRVWEQWVRPDGLSVETWKALLARVHSGFEERPAFEVLRRASPHRSRGTAEPIIRRAIADAATEAGIAEPFAADADARIRAASERAEARVGDLGTRLEARFAELRALDQLFIAV